MFDIGFLEILIIGVIGLLVLGPERLPKAAYTVGKWAGKAKRVVRDFSSELDRQMELEALKERLAKHEDVTDVEKELKQVTSSVDEALKSQTRFDDWVDDQLDDPSQRIHPPGEDHEYEPLPENKQSKG